MHVFTVPDAFARNVITAGKNSCASRYTCVPAFATSPLGCLPRSNRCPPFLSKRFPFLDSQSARDLDLSTRKHRRWSLITVGNNGQIKRRSFSLSVERGRDHLSSARINKSESDTPRDKNVCLNRFFCVRSDRLFELFPFFLSFFLSNRTMSQDEENDATCRMRYYRLYGSTKSIQRAKSMAHSGTARNVRRVFRRQSALSGLAIGRSLPR